jgi:hypothetical protein
VSGWFVLSESAAAAEDARHAADALRRRDFAVGLGAYGVLVLVAAAGLGIGLHVGASVVRELFAGGTA